MKVWDILGGGKMLTCFSNSHKTVTCLSIGTDASRLLVGSADQHVRVYDMTTFETIHTFDYSAPVLSLAMPVISIRFFMLRSLA